MSDLEWVRRDGVGRWEAESGSSPFQVLGPYTIAFDTPNLASDFIPVPGSAVLPVGTVLFSVFVFVTADWASDGGRVAIGIATTPSDFQEIWHLDGAFQSQPGTPNGVGERVAPSTAGASNVGAIVGRANTFLYVTMDSVAAQGSSSIYVLANVPSMTLIGPA